MDTERHSTTTMLPKRVKAYAILMPVVAAGALFVGSVVWPGRWPTDWWLPLVFAATTGTALLFPLRLARSTKMTVDLASDFAALLLFGPVVAMLLAGLGNLAANLALAARGRRDRWNVLFNTGQSMVGIGLAGVVVYAVLPPHAPAAVDEFRALVAVLLAGGALYLFNSAAVAVAVALQHQHNPLTIWLESRHVELLHSLTLLVGGLLTALLVQHHRWAIALLALLMGAIYVSLRQLLDVLAREQMARLAAEAAAAQVQRLQQVTDAALAHLSLDDLLQELLARIRQVLAVDTAAILLVEEAGPMPAHDPREEDQLAEDRLVGDRFQPGQRPVPRTPPGPAAARAHPPGAAPLGGTLIVRAGVGFEVAAVREARIPIGEGFVGRIAAERRPISIEDLDCPDPTDPTSPGAPLSGPAERGLAENGPAERSLLGLPLLVEGRVLGVLRVGTHQPRRFTPDERHLLQLVADRAALAIAHARLYEAEQVARTNMALLYEAERQARATAEQAVRVRSEFLSLAAHELRTPVTSLRGYVQLLLRQLARGADGTTGATRGAADLDAAKVHRALQTIDQQSDKLTRLVNQLLDVSRLQQGTLVLERRLTDVTAVVAEGVAATRATTVHPLVLHAPGPVWAWIDPLRVEQVVVNLLDNAIKYNVDEGPIEVILEQPTPEVVRLAVRDRGIGIPLEYRQHIFERFYQVDGSRHVGGMGLGLYISRQIVEVQGGHIAVEAPPDGGTCFVITLPTALAALPVSDPKLDTQPEAIAPAAAAARVAVASGR
ncbi:MAG: GAF domain-containing sensor histidine kinase [Chloroflexi bacterium]|nr:GAF domain-containing sensor histidine kinase [Chloroflexota bacterium]